jgi:hypothetical protein
MENAERELIQKLANKNFELKKLYNLHRRYEERLATLGRLAYLTPNEAQEQRKLKQMKLQGVERMLKLVLSADQQLAA